MQKVAAYLLERRSGLTSAVDRATEGERIRTSVMAWLKAKGATPDGSYLAIDKSRACYEIRDEVYEDRRWTLYRLTEESSQGRKFDANLSVTVGHSSVMLFVTLEIGLVTTQVNQIDSDPKCPKIIRELLSDGSIWHHGSSQLKLLHRIEGFDAGEILAAEILNQTRTIPLVVVSTIDRKPILEGLDTELSFDLAGLANVYVIDDDASWALTDELRKPFSCYSGAIRIYWPSFSLSQDPFHQYLWTAPRLHPIDLDEKTSLDRIRRQIRTRIMRASAASVVRPKEIDEIRTSFARSEYSSLREKASSREEFMHLADSYAKENDRLREESAEANEFIESLQARISRLEAKNESLQNHLRRAEQRFEESSDEEIAPDLPEQGDQNAQPQQGDVRFYKKHYSTANRDVMIRASDCGHSAWQGSTKGDKARKGILKLEGVSTLDRMQHCGTCTGGGMWRVQW